MKRYEVQLFSNDDLENAVELKTCDNIILALDYFTGMCEDGREYYDLDEYHVWLYDHENLRNIIFYSYAQDDDYGTYEELTPCQW